LTKADSLSSLSEPEFVLKHRLVGAVILIGFGVLVLPWVLGGSDSESAQVKQQTTAVAKEANDGGTKVFVSRITPIGGATPPILTEEKPVTPVAEAAPENPPVETPAPAASKPSEAAPAPAKEKAKQPIKVQTAKAEPELRRGWVVRIGTFSKIDNAKRVMATLSSKGFKPKSGKIETKTGVATRVWVGPYAKRVDAARIRVRIEQVTGEKGLITPYP